MPPTRPSRFQTFRASWPGRLIGLALAVLPLLWLSRQIHWRDVASSVARIGPRNLLLSCLCQIGAIFVGAVRWRVLLRSYGADPRKLPTTLELFRHAMVGVYFAVLPSGFVGEAVRGIRVAHCLPSPSTSYVVILVERIAGLTGLLILAGVGALALPGDGHRAIAFAMNLAVAASVGLLFVAFVLPQFANRMPRVSDFVKRVPIAGPILAKIPAAVDLRGPALSVLLSLGTQGLAILVVAALIGPLDAHATIRACMSVVPVIILVTYIPLTPGGLGQREVAFVYFFALIGVGGANAVAASLALFVVSTSMALVGGLILIYERFRASSAA